MDIIKSNQNSLVKQIEQLKEKKHRDKQKRFFIEGARFVEEAFAESVKIEYLILSESFVSANDKMFKSIIKSALPYYIFCDKLFSKISDTINPQGILAVIKSYEYNIDNLINNKSFIIVLDSIQDPGNLGTILRTSDAMGVSGIVMSKGCVDIYNPKVLRSTMGSVFRVPFVVSENICDVLAYLKQKQIIIFAADIEESVNSFEIRYPENLAIIIGNEANGISEGAMSWIDKKITIPMIGRIESLNAAVAAGMFMYEVMKQRRSNN